MKDRSQTIVQEDKAPSHAHHVQGAVYILHKVIRLLWTGNSPDLNMIEPCWGHLKRITTEKDAPKSQKKAAKAWSQAWKDLKQSQIQHWIKQIERHIKKVIQLKGGNNYQEDHARDPPKKPRRHNIYS